ncbi:16S rRNA (uracil(1498)-N(3))-methyltransferase [Helicobacter sp. 13S00482-2]|uniref:16S rRNA (uracil(1498)-N(3))-methyltransferase n=1 Tax=Helicobacter sp. 13S00482-2 TaxID=1476200 RepID=UPI000BA736D9|nr:16S rRNA (uracil(1498)-N(3))-methyltransferase [Helicobacter sp. 13S00482-2]PAF53695.1 16S rRNA (uracil(1498)-N(3))-methyltransferase [Helicobacter sp. 13S00482-2]
MRFVYHSDAGNDTISLKGDLYSHIYQVRRTKFEENILLRNLKDDNIYTYAHIQISKKQADLKLLECSHNPNPSTKKIHLIWAIIETKNIEKNLPYLNQLGVSKISFFYANRSQKNEKINLERLYKILLHSCEQCGRTDLMTLEIISNTSEALRLYPNACLFDFGGKNITEGKLNFAEGIFLGPEGGFDDKEKILLNNQVCYSTKDNFVLKSECGALFLSSLTY